MTDTPSETISHRPHLVRNIFGVIVLLGALAGYWRFNAGQHSSTQQVYDNLAVQEARLHNLEQTVNAQEKRLSTLEEKKPSSSVAFSATTPASSSNVGNTPTTDVESRIAALEKSVNTLKTAPAAVIAGAPVSIDVTQTLHMLSALHHLSDKVMSGKPYTTELAAMAELTNSDDASTKSLELLVPFAESGIPTLASLLKSFDNSVQQLNANESTPPADAGAFDRFVYNITHVIHIRRIDDMQTGKSIDAIVGRAQAHLEQEETEAAIAEIQSLPDNARSIFSGWLEEAQMSIKVPGIIETLEDHVLALTFRSASPAPDAEKK